MPKSFTVVRPPGQWLAHSFGWAMSCLGGWLLLVSLLLRLQHVAADYAGLVWALVLGVSVAAHWLLWRKAWVGAWDGHLAAGGWLPEMAARCWLVALTLFQIASLYLLLVAVSVLLGWDAGGDWGSSNTH